MDTITIQGTVAWCNPFEPNKKFVKPHGVYDVAINVEPERAEKLCEYLDDLAQKKLDQAIKDAPANKKTQLAESLSIVPTGSKSRDMDGNETGETLIKAKLQAVVDLKDGGSFTQKPVVFDSEVTPITEPVKVTAKSTVKIVVEPYPYVMLSNKTVGVSLRFKQLQIIHLAESMDTSGLEAVEGGFVAAAVAKDNNQEARFEDDIPSVSKDSANDEGDF
jgi:hypothetical protein